MEKITVREFRKNLSSYLARIKQGESFEVNGVHITLKEIYTNKGTYTDPQIEEKELKKSTKGKFEHAVQNAPLGFKEFICEKCKKPNNECYRLWEEGEERIVCIDCIKKSVSSKMLKSYLRKLNKL